MISMHSKPKPFGSTHSINIAKSNLLTFHSHPNYIYLLFLRTKRLAGSDK